jgi:hypothetical protein
MTVKYNHYRMFQATYGAFGPYKVTKENRFRDKGDKMGAHMVDALLPHGGMTIVTLSDEDGPLCRGYAYCNDNDLFNKRLGRLIALNRALFLLDNPKSDGALTYFGKPKREWLREH